MSGVSSASTTSLAAKRVRPSSKPTLNISDARNLVSVLLHYEDFAPTGWAWLSFNTLTERDRAKVFLGQATMSSIALKVTSTEFPPTSTRTRKSAQKEGGRRSDIGSGLGGGILPRDRGRYVTIGGLPGKIGQEDVWKWAVRPCMTVSEATGCPIIKLDE